MNLWAYCVDVNRIRRAVPRMGSESPLAPSWEHHEGYLATAKEEFEDVLRDLQLAFSCEDVAEFKIRSLALYDGVRIAPSAKDEIVQAYLTEKRERERGSSRP